MKRLVPLIVAFVLAIQVLPAYAQQPTPFNVTVTDPNFSMRIYNSDLPSGDPDPSGGYVDVKNVGGALVVFENGVTVTNVTTQVITLVGLDLNNTSVAGGGTFVTTTSEVAIWGDHWGWGFSSGPNFALDLAEGTYNLQNVQGFPENIFNDRVTKKVYVPVNECSTTPQDPNFSMRIYNSDLPSGDPDPSGGYVDVKNVGGALVVFENGVTVTNVTTQVITLVGLDLNNTSVAGGGTFVTTTSEVAIWGDHWGWGFSSGPNFALDLAEGTYNLQNVQGFPENIFNDRVTKKVYVPAECKRSFKVYMPMVMVQRNPD